ncbi:6TM ABC transporter family protein [Streptomyces flaveolus]|uniref:hypothetical protein n=1 Tax=Streptomyces flaveolus TaxID=67297 RepID=UPI0037028AED
MKLRRAVRHAAPVPGLRRLFSVAAPEGEQVVAAAPALPVRQIFRRFWPYTHGGRKWLLPLVAFCVVGPAIDAAEIWLFKVVVDEVLVQRDLSPFLPIALAYVGLGLASGVLSFADDVTSTWVGERFLLALRADVGRRLRPMGRPLPGRLTARDRGAPARGRQLGRGQRHPPSVRLSRSE